MSDLTRVNGNVIGWGSLTFKLGGVSFRGFTEVSYGQKMEDALVYGMGRHQAPQGATQGKYVPDLLKVKGRFASVNALKLQAAATSPTGRSFGAGALRFSGVLFYTEPGIVGSPGESHRVEFAGLRIVEDTISNTEGSDPSTPEISLRCLAYREDGMVMFDDSEGSPF